MTDPYNQYYLYYDREDSYGSYTIASGSQTWSLGTFSSGYEIPEATFEPVSFSENDTRDLTYFAGKAKVEGTLTFDLVHGIPIFLGMGACSNNDAGTPKVHTITGAGATTDLPSFFLQSKMNKSDVSDFARNVYGCKVDQLDISGKINEPVKCTMKITASKITSGTPFANAPTLPTNSATTPFKFKASTATYNSTEQAVLVSFRFSVRNSLNQVWTHRSSDSEWIEFLDEADERSYNVSLGFIASEHAIFDDVLTQTKRTFVLELVRTADSDDITITCSNCLPTVSKYPIPNVKDKIMVAVVLNPQTVSITVNDSIVGADFYV